MDMYQKREMRKKQKMDDNKKSLPSTSINWYPGHMKKTKDEINKIMPIVDIVYELVDARVPYSSKIKDIDNLIKNKKRILIMTKKDLCDEIITSKWIKYYEDLGYKVALINLNDNNDYKKVINITNELVKDLNEKRALKGMLPKDIKCAVIGVPNVGKSTFINKLAGKTATKVGNMPGVTKNLTWLKTNYKITVLDTPGILWPKFDNNEIAFNLGVTTAINENVLPLMETSNYILKFLNQYYPEIFHERFKLEEYNENVFDEIGKNIGALKNGETDYNRVCKYIINEVKNEKIKNITFDR